MGIFDFITNDPSGAFPKIHPVTYTNMLPHESFKNLSEVSVCAKII